MASNTDKWLRYLSPIFWGWFDPLPSGVTRADPWISAVVVFNGWFWSRIGGGQHLRKGVGGAVPSLLDPIVGISNGAEGEITEAPFLASHGTDERQTYRVTPVGGGGVEGNDFNMVREVVIVSNALVPLLPNPPISLAVSPRKDGTFSLNWKYDTRGQQIAPANFRIYTDQGTGTIDFVTEIGMVAFVASKETPYTFTTVVTAGSDWERWLFVVRSETSTVGHLEQNETVIAVLNSDTAQEDVVDPTVGPVDLASPAVPTTSVAK